MKKSIFYFLFAAACIMGGVVINNTSLCKVLLENDVNSYTEPNGGSCEGAPAKCEDGGCWASSCHLHATVTYQYIVGSDETELDVSKTAKDNEFACCWAEYTWGFVSALKGACYPLSCCNM